MHKILANYNIDMLNGTWLPSVDKFLLYLPVENLV